jgi:hypothetical protein
VHAGTERLGSPDCHAGVFLRHLVCNLAAGFDRKDALFEFAQGNLLIGIHFVVSNLPVFLVDNQWQVTFLRQRLKMADL